MLTMRGGPQVTNGNGVKMSRPPPVPPRPDKNIVADALAKSRKVPAPILPPGLKKELTSKVSPESTQLQNDVKPNKLPSPKLNGLSRVKSFIRDVMNDKKHSEDKKSHKEDTDKSKTKSQIPVPQIQTLPKHKPTDSPSTNSSHDETVKSQSVVRSLCGLMNSDKSSDEENKIERVRVVKSNSFAEKAVPVRKAPPPPISPKPSKKLIEEKLSRNQNRNEGFSLRKLSVSCEELNNTARPIVFASINKIGSPLLIKKSIPPCLPSGKPPVSSKKKALSSSPVGPGINGFDFPDKSISTENLNKNICKEENNKSHKYCDKDDFTEKLISEIISAKNDILLSSFQNDTKPVTTNHATKDTNTSSNLSFHDTVIKSTLANNNQVHCVNVHYEKNLTKKHSDDNSTCGSDSNGSATGKTVLFINTDSDQSTKQNTPETVPVLENNDVKLNDNFNRINDIANHELLIAELQHMRKEATEPKANNIDYLLDNSDVNKSKDIRNIQQSGWEHVDNDGKKYRYSSCQIVIEDQSPVDDSGICLENVDTNDSYCLSPTLLSRLKEQYYANLKMSSLQGLPPLPKSLSGFNVTESPSQIQKHQQQQHPQPPPVPARSAASFRYGARAGSNSPPVTNPTPEAQKLNRKPTTLDTQLALLKREMLSLRQLDLSLLSQLWSLNEAIHEFRQYMNGEGGGGGGRVNGGGEGEGEEDDGEDSSSGGEESPQRL